MDFKKFFLKAALGGYRLYLKLNQLLHQCLKSLSSLAKVARKFDRATIAFVHDISMAFLVVPLALFLRVGDDILDYSFGVIFTHMACFTLLATGIFLVLRVYRGVWRYVSLSDTLGILKATAFIILSYAPIFILLTNTSPLPRSLIVIIGFVLFFLLIGPRFLYFILKDRHQRKRGEHHVYQKTPILIVGAGDGAEAFVRQMSRDPHAKYEVVGLIADKKSRVGRRIHGKEIFGELKDVTSVVDHLTRKGSRPELFLMAESDFPPSVYKSFLDVSEKLNIQLLRLPHGQVAEKLAAFELKPIAVEDFLGRPQAKLDREGIGGLIKGQRVLITGAGGSIGSELVRQIASLKPAHITLLDNSEYLLYSIDLELSERFPTLSKSAVLGNVVERDRLNNILVKEAPGIVFHAAALKHVPLVELNPNEGALTNTIGTRNMAEACRMSGVKAMIFISTDKAVNPTNVMGASKRLAESYCQALDLVEGARTGGTRYITVRFGNVLGSTGSVIPLFKRQIARGGPVTVTHPDMIRYFMTIREAVELVLQAGLLGTQSYQDGGKIFVLNMGEPVKIVDLARQMIRIAGLRPERDIEI
ncbi:MAG: polysaccharide biosynthesis protein, partial [Alphaproteobacteria bacterium]|nr:polysaccharide biosynthesis protein [Alphaproteobacteria bacterium]